MSIQCEICKKQLNTITTSHVKTHGITLKEYISQFPDSPTVSPEVSKKLSDRTKKLNSNRDYSMIGSKISETKKKKIESGEIVPWNKGISLSEDHKKKLSDSKKGKSTRDGAILSDDTKNKISNSLKERSQTPEKIEERKLKKEQREKEREQREKDKFQFFANNIKQNDLELISIDYIDRSVIIKCSKCNHVFTRTKQSVESSKCNKTVCRVCNPPLMSSNSEIDISNFIKNIGFEVTNNDRSVLGGKEIDILVKDKNIGIEFNGLYWHSELNRGEPKHLLWKQQFAHNKGIRLIHIFEDEWNNKREIVESRLRHILGIQHTKIYARTCEIRQISSKEKNDFLLKNHLQGADISKVCYGLFFKGELVSVMTFKPGSFVKGHREGWELNRFASKLNTRVIGAASKLFKRFIKDFNPEKVISFADRRWNTGSLYEQLGFKFSHCSSPSYWYLEKYSKRIHRGKFMKHTLIKTEEDKLKTEWEIMQERGFDRIWDCGTVVYSWSSKV